MTADKDDPRFDEFYRAGNETRMFTALFLPDMPTYTGLGFEIRDVRWEPAPNEHYTKLFVFHEHGESNVFPSKARFSDTYVWGKNNTLFANLTRLQVFAEPILATIAGTATTWLIPPDATTLRGTTAWTQNVNPGSTKEPRYVFLANYDLERDSGYFGIPALAHEAVLEPLFSTVSPDHLPTEPIIHNGFFHRLPNLSPGEGRVYLIR